MSSAFDYFWAPDEGVDVEDIRDLVPFVVERAPNTDPNEVRRALASAVNCFLTESGVWRREDIPAIAREGEVCIGSAGCARIVSVEAVRRMSDNTTLFDASSQYQSPTKSIIRDDGSGIYVVLDPNAKTGDQYEADVVLTVRLGSELCPRWVMERWGEAIASKAAHELITKGVPATTTHIQTYRTAVQSVVARKAMGGSSRSSGSGSAISSIVERI
jgi:hypothetical protein